LIPVPTSSPRAGCKGRDLRSLLGAHARERGPQARAGFCDGRKRLSLLQRSEAKLRPLSAPTLGIRGEGDSDLGSDLAEPHREDVPNLDRAKRIADASHWVHHDQAERVNQLLIDFFAPAAAT
jgi:pimeloyl-ACP methyl ester carboxylesterase